MEEGAFSDIVTLGRSGLASSGVGLGSSYGIGTSDVLAAIEAGPMGPEELAWMKRVGAGIRASAGARRGGRAIRLVDELMGAGEGPGR